MTQSRTSLYKATIAKLKERYAGKMDILCGLEWDLFSDDDPYAYDYFIGSAHYVKGPKTGKYYEIDWREEDLRACIDDDFDGDGLAVAEAYFANVAKDGEEKRAVLGRFRKDYFPSDAILKEWLVLSGNVVITADAHDTKALTYGFEEAAAHLKELGYTKVQVLGKNGFTPCEL